MNLVTLTYEIHEEDQANFIEALEEMKSVWEERSIVFSLFRDVSHPSRFHQHLYTERSVDEIAQIIQEDPDVKQLFDTIKSTAGTVTLAFMERVV